MKAFILDRYGKKQALRLGDMPEPVPGPDDVLVEVEAAGLNLLNSKIRNGEFKPILPYKPPLVLGHDLAGTVVKVGANVRRFKPGDAVYARPRDGQIGAFAERIAVKESRSSAKARQSVDGASRVDPAGRADRLAGAGRARADQAGTEGADPRRIGRCRHLRHPARQASRRDRRDDGQRRQRRHW